MKLSSNGFNHHSPEGEIDCLNSELWHACAGPLVSLPTIGSHVVYFPQGHSEQVAASTNKEVDSQTPNYPSLPPQLICQLHNATMHADSETDEVYAQMTLQPLTPQKQEVSFLPADLGAPNKQPTNYFCKTLTASDTSTHGGFSVPRRAAEKVFPPLDFSLQPPVQELIGRDLHNNEWKFRHIFRGQPKRHLLTTGWSVFVSAKRLVAGDSVLFIWNDKNQLFVGTRRANRPQTVMPSSFLSSDSMHLGLLAAAAHAAATNSRFTIFYNPRASPSEFVIPLAKYVKAVYHTRVSVGMRFRMLFETEESSIRRYMGTITGISDLDPAKWPNSHWRSVKVGWDESTAGKRQPRVSLWEIEPLTTFPMYPSAFPLRLKRPWPQDLPSFIGTGNNMGFNSPLMYPCGDVRMQSLNFQGMGVTPWMMQPRLDNSVIGMQQTDLYQAMAATALQEMRVVDPTKHVPSQFPQFQQPQDLSNFVQPQILQHSQSLSPFNQNIPLSQSQTPAQSNSNLLLQQLRHQNSFNNSQYVLPAVSQLSSNSQGDSSSRQNFVESNIKPVLNDVNSPFRSLMGSVTQEEASNLVNVSQPSNLLSSNGWPTKRVALDPLLSNNQNQLGVSNTNVTQIPVSLPPFPGGERLIEQEGSNDAQNHFLFGVNIDNSCGFVHSGMSNLNGVGSENKNATVGFASPSYVSGSVADYSCKASVISNGCISDQGFVQQEDTGHVNPPNRNFVKVYKSGSFGRSLDLSMFSSYQELRGELAHMFGLEAQLEDPLRSGWQLVFVDRENDILLLGDDPWPEFVNSVWCIKILSPQDVQEMGKRGLELLNSGHKLPLLPNDSCDGGGGYGGRQAAGNNMNAGIPSVSWDTWISDQNSQLCFCL